MSLLLGCVRGELVLQKSSVDFSKSGGICPGGMCCLFNNHAGWNFNPCKNCIFIPESYWIEADTISFQEEPGPGACLLCLPLVGVFCAPVIYCALCTFWCAESNRGFLGLNFSLVDGKVQCLVNQKHLTKEEATIVLPDVVDFRVMSEVHPMIYSRTTRANNHDLPPTVSLDMFEILHRDSNGMYHVCRTPVLLHSEGGLRHGGYGAM